MQIVGLVSFPCGRLAPSALCTSEAAGGRASQARHGMGAERRWGEGWGKGPLRWPQPSSRPLSYKALPRAHRQRSQHPWIAVFARCRSAARRERSRDGSQATEQHHKDSRGQQLVTAPFPVPSFGCQGSCGAAHPISLAAPCSEGTKRTAECIDGDSHGPYQKTAASITKSPGSTPAPAPPHLLPRSWVRGLGHDVRT